MKFPSTDPRALASRAFFLAYEASAVMGMGILQAQHGATEEAVFANVVTRGDYPAPAEDATDCYADYCFGRMMKLGIRIDADGVTVSDGECRADYQSWCSTYPSYAALIEAAQASLAEDAAKEASA